ncbi:Carbamoyl-phosphate synthase small chain [Trichinella spiralis]|uniref:Carbamoyl-phosphate synthase small chain n=1 Tax=Trichinella spiralis TaxID=6334 RepID=A0ABR3KDN2_TRISP
MNRRGLVEESTKKFNPQAVGELNDARVVGIRLMERRAVVKHYKNRWLVVAQELSVSTLMLKESVKIPSHGP